MLHLPECVLILDELTHNLPSYIDYHNVSHTLDVYHCAMAIADYQGMSGSDRKLIGIAAVYHDAGYISKSVGHEEISCVIAATHLKRFDYSSEDIKTICGIIMATRVPQEAITLLQQIICDADMDYLGRTDFETLGDRLYNELHDQGRVSEKSQWNLSQAEFLKQHHYYTNYAIEHRNPTKQQNLKILESKIASL